MKKKLNILPSIASLFGLFAVSSLNLVYADGEDEKNRLSGCYTATSGFYEIATAVLLIDGQPSPREIGQYRVVLTPDDDENEENHEEENHEKKENHEKEKNKKRDYILFGPILGHPYAKLGSTFLTRHVFGTFNRTGTFTANEGNFNILIGSCPDKNGNPQFVEAVETTIFNNAIGTGNYSGIESGSITWVGTVNACDDPTNRVANFKISSGNICFK